MHTTVKNKWGHEHNFVLDTQKSEKKVNIVFALTTVTMVVEIVGGTWFGSMALLADGWHMFTHSAAFAISMFVYWFAKRHQHNPAYSFGTGKVNTLGAFASAVALGTVALMMVVESVERLFAPQAIHFSEAIWVAVIGLGVNVISAVVLHDSHHHSHGAHEDLDHHHACDHDHDHDHDHHQHDHNLKAAYFHVLADTLTSLLAIIALVAGMYFNWLWADALMGIVGSVVIGKWAYGLIRDSSGILLDKAPSKTLSDKIRASIEQDNRSVVTDLHCWKLSGNHLSVQMAIATSTQSTADEYKALLKDAVEADHITIEVNRL